MKYYAKETNEAVSWEIEHQKLARKIAGEGIVLLENNGVLPLDKKIHTVALYGNGARKTIKGGTGSGDVNSRYSVSVEDGLENAGYEVVTKQWLDRYDQKMELDFVQWRKELEAEAVQKNKMFVSCYLEMPHCMPTEIVTKMDIVAADIAVYVVARRSGEGADRSAKEGDYYLFQDELDALSLLGQNYKNTIVVLNSGGVMDTSFYKEIEGLSALIVMSQAGMEGGNALCDILTGIETPSGKLADTYAVDYKDYPSSDKFSYYAENAREVVYEEEIFVGYRKFGSNHKRVNYCFGYGLSYTDFLIEHLHTEHNKVSETTKISMRVTNVGKSYSGKEVLQVYCMKEIKDVDTPKKELMTFGKSKNLKPQETEQLTFYVTWRELAIFDVGLDAWVLKKGSYKFFVGDSLDNACQITELEILTDKVYRNELHKQQQISAEEFSLTTEEMIDLVVGFCGKSNLELIGNASIKVPGAAGETVSVGDIPHMVLVDGGSGIRLQHIFHTDLKDNVIDNDIMSSLERGAFSHAMERNEGKCYYQYCTAWPITALLAQTWNKQILFQMGEAVSVEMQEYGAHIWLAPAMNIHRNPLCGRNFEYFSEDPVVTGKLASYICKGVQNSAKTGVTIKHFAANNQELYRTEMNSIISKRTLREIYLKAFEIVVKEANPVAIMTSYNRLNGTYTANNEWLCKEIARNEWGYQGIIMTDWGTTDSGKSLPWKCIDVGNDLIMPGCEADKANIREALRTKELSIDRLRECAFRISKIAKKMNS